MARGEDGTLFVRSKGAVMFADAPERMFTQAVDTAKALDLHPGWTYRCEYLQKPKQTTLAYNRTPERHLIIFDINTGMEEYLPYDGVVQEASRIGLEVVPLLFSGMLTDINILRDLLDNTESILGGQKIEGVVIKPIGYSLYGLDKKALMGKFVSEAFREIHSREWKSSNPSSGDVLDMLGTEYGTPARWNKAISHLRDAGQIEDSPRDIGKLIKAVQEDVKKECEDEIKDKLFKWAWPHVCRKVSGGLPGWYKEELLKRQFEGNGICADLDRKEKRL